MSAAIALALASVAATPIRLHQDPKNPDNKPYYRQFEKKKKK